MAGGAQLIAVRHGRTEWNAEGRFQGQADPDLDSVGWEQANAAAVAVAAVAGGRQWQTVSVVSSDLRRARSTASRIGAALEVPVALDARLREVALGGWEGLLEDEVALRYPEEWAAWLDGRAGPRGGGETTLAAGRRVAEAVMDALAGTGAGPGARGDSHSDDAPRTVVIVGHGLSLELALARLAGEGWLHFDGPPPHLANGEVLVLPAIGGGVPLMEPVGQVMPAAGCASL